jgi:sugar transferase EpsL
MSFYKNFGKRAFDLVLAGGALVVLSPVIGLLTVLIAVKLGRPVLFYQERTGYRRRAFHIIKFRSMLNAIDADGQPLPDEQRLTPFGQWLRNWSLDELPSLWNIIRGDMTIVGPRPFIHRYDALYSPYQAQRFRARPGITGWAQVNGRNSLSWPEKFALDVWYVENQRFSLDMKIMIATVSRVFARHGINSANAATMPPFQGERGDESALEVPDGG